MSEESTEKETKNNNNNTEVAKTTRVKLVSRLKYPVILTLTDGESVFIAPHGTIESIDPDVIASSLPPGVQQVEFQV